MSWNWLLFSFVSKKNYFFYPKKRRSYFKAHEKLYFPTNNLKVLMMTSLHKFLKCQLLTNTGTRHKPTACNTAYKINSEKSFSIYLD